MTSPTVSVIIPTYNRQATLERAIRSVWQQSYQDFELIVVDDGSADNSSALIGRLQKERPFCCIKQERNSGVSAARNRGVQEAQGLWLSFLDSDDEWLPEKLQRQMDYISQNPMCPVVHTDEIWVRNGVRVNPMKKHTKQGGDLYSQALRLCCISPSTVLIRRDVFYNYGGFREDYPVCEDYDLWLHLSAENEIGYVDEKLIIKYGGHEDQLSRRYKAMDYYRVKSIHHVLNQRFLTENKRRDSINVLCEKSEILLKGYQKHNNKANYQEVQSLHQQWSNNI